MSGADADAPPPSDDGVAEQLRACRDRDAARRRLRGRVGAIVRAVRAPLADVLRDHALVHLPPAAAARLRLVHPSWARAVASPLFAVAHAAAPRRLSGLFSSSSSSAAGSSLSFLPLDAGADTVPSPSLAFLPSSSPPAVLSSTHGVACCFSAADDAYFVCNPATGSWQGVPCPPCRVTWPRPAVVVVFDAGVYNFGGDFALVCAFESSAPGSGIYCFAVFSSVAGAWWVADAVAPAEGLIPASGVAAGGTAWWRTSIGTAVGYNLVAGQVHLAVCPGDSGQWEIGAAAGTLHCAVRGGGDVVVFRLDAHGGWEVAATVSVAEILQRPWQPQPDLELTYSDDVRLLPFQGAEVEVVVLDGRRVVAFDTAARRRRVAVLPDQPAGADWGAAAFAAHTNTLALVAPVVLMEPPDDQETS